MTDHRTCKCSGCSTSSCACQNAAPSAGRCCCGEECTCDPECPCDTACGCEVPKKG